MFRTKLCFVRAVEVKPVEKLENDDFSRKMIVTDKNGDSIELVLKGSANKDLLFKGLKD